MLQANTCFIRRDSREGCGRIGHFRPEFVNAYQTKLRGFSFKRQALIAQKFYTATRKDRTKPLVNAAMPGARPHVTPGIFMIIVVAENRDYTVGRVEQLEQFIEFFQCGWLIINQIAGQHD